MSVLWISHRGESADAPENTRAAFDLARERNTDGSECDVHLSLDGEVMVSHDCSTQRMGDRSVTIEELTAEELRRVNLTGHHKERYPVATMPFFREILDINGKRLLFAELKHEDPALADAVKKEVEAAHFPLKRLFIISFHAEACRYAKTILPECRVLWLTADPTLSAEELISQVRQLNVDGIDADVKMSYLTPEGVRTFHEAGLFVAVWVVDQPEDMRRMLRAKVDAITSNRADALRKTYRDDPAFSQMEQEIK